MRIVFLMGFVTVLSMLGGCASIVDGTKQSLSVTTEPVTGASCILTNSKGTWFVDNTPGSVVVHRAYGDMHVTCHKNSCETDDDKVKSKTKAMAFGNIVFGGIIGAGVDIGDGAAYDYPKKIVVPMQCKESR